MRGFARIEGASLDRKLAPIIDFYNLSRARIYEGVAPHSLLTRNFCRTAGAIIFGLLIGLTW
jgi:hypothetical protein